MNPDTSHALLAVLVLMVALVGAAAMVRRYQQHKAGQRARLRALVLHADHIEQLLRDLAMMPLSASLRAALLEHLAAQYAAIAATSSDFPGVNERLEQARQRKGQDEAVGPESVPKIPDRKEYLRLYAILDRLSGVLKTHGGRLPQADVLLPEWRLEVRERRAELDTRYLIQEAHRAEATANPRKSVQLLDTLLYHLQEKGPPTSLVRGLYSEVMTLRARALAGGLTAPQAQEALPEAPGQSLKRSSAA